MDQFSIFLDYETCGNAIARYAFNAPNVKPGSIVIKEARNYKEKHQGVGEYIHEKNLSFNYQVPSASSLLKQND